MAYILCYIRSAIAFLGWISRRWLVNLFCYFVTNLMVHWPNWKLFWLHIGNEPDDLTVCWHSELLLVYGSGQACELSYLGIAMQSYYVALCDIITPFSSIFNVNSLFLLVYFELIALRLHILVNVLFCLLALNLTLAF